uniref:DNA sliding clamp PCNA n=1 Tax=Neobodo designis TaxID=312471 RepID=A0A7S1LP66_NEODS
MFEAQIAQGLLWKKIVEAVKELVAEANFQTTPSGVGIQAMDAAHVALVSLSLRCGGFAVYSCERQAMLGINLQSLGKILKATENNDVITLRHIDDSDVLSIVAEAQDKSKQSEFQLKLMEIDAESMSIPEMTYSTTIKLGSADFAKICRDMAIFGDTVTIAVSREGVKFSASSDFGEGFVFLRTGATADSVVKRESGVKREPGVKKENVKKEAGVKAEPMRDEDDDTPIVATKAAAAAAGAGENDATVSVEMEEPLTLSFALRYFGIFSKASTLASRVTICLAGDAPCMIEFEIDGLGHLRYYLAPKVEED